MCSTILIGVLFIIVRTLKPHRCPSTKEKIKKMWYIHNDFYLVIRKNGMLIFAWKWMELEEHFLSEVSQTHLSEHFYQGNIHNKVFTSSWMPSPTQVNLWGLLSWNFVGLLLKKKNSNGFTYFWNFFSYHCLCGLFSHCLDLCITHCQSVLEHASIDSC